jgi:hypothetical protein
MSRPLFSDFQMQRSVFEPGSVSVDLVVEEVALGQISLSTYLSPCCHQHILFLHFKSVI